MFGNMPVPGMPPELPYDVVCKVVPHRRRCLPPLGQSHPEELRVDWEDGVTAADLRIAVEIASALVYAHTPVDAIEPFYIGETGAASTLRPWHSDQPRLPEERHMVEKGARAGALPGAGHRGDPMRRRAQAFRDRADPVAPADRQGPGLQTD